jgi:hypothetical protein
VDRSGSPKPQELAMMLALPLAIVGIVVIKSLELIARVA